MASGVQAPSPVSQSAIEPLDWLRRQFSEGWRELQLQKQSASQAVSRAIFGSLVEEQKQVFEMAIDRYRSGAPAPTVTDLRRALKTGQIAPENEQLVKDLIKRLSLEINQDGDKDE
jgi:hypothetical protein